MTRFTITQQRQAVEHVIDQFGAHSISDVTTDALKQAALTLALIERKVELYREIERLDREAPELLTVLKEFPAARIVGVR